MEPVTLLIAAIGSLAVFSVRPIMGIIFYVAVLAWYPSYLTLKVGTLDFSASRIVILALYASILFRTKLAQQFKWCWLDRLLIIALLGTVISGMMNEPFWKIVENRSGTAFNTLLPYFAVRMIVTSREKFLTVLKGFLVIGTPLAIVGAYQSLTGHNPVGFLHQYGAWTPREAHRYFRYGLYRAEVTFSVSILFGLFFAMIAPCCAGLWGHIKHLRLPIAAGIGLMLIGLVSSASSAAFLAGLVALLLLSMFPIRRYWPALLIVLVAGCIFVEVFSNRHFYSVPASFTFSSATAYYRIGLIEEAFGGGMTGHWIEGYGLIGMQPDRLGWVHWDLTNQYIGILARFGLLGLLPFLVVIVASLIRLRRAFVLASPNKADQWMIWCLLASVAGILIAMNTVSLFDQSGNLFYILLGLSGAMPVILSSVPAKTKPLVETWRYRVDFPFPEMADTKNFQQG